MIMLKTILFLLLLMCLNLNAQNNITSGGIDIKGEGGNVSQSIGQINYTTISSDEGTMSQGVIQVWEITVISGMEVKNIELYCNAYPNPVLNSLSLLVENFEEANFNYQLVDLNGRIISMAQITDKISSIDMSSLVPATYIVQVIDKNTILKSFKIVKI
jgi:hypothetical protein